MVGTLKIRLKNFILSIVKEFYKDKMDEFTFEVAGEIIKNSKALSKHDLNVIYVPIGKMPVSKAEEYIVKLSKSIKQYKLDLGFDEKDYPIIYVAWSD
jgi:urate oxidase